MFYTTCLHASENAEPLVIEMPELGVRITVPGMPKIEMGVHPLNEQSSVYRLHGTNGITSVSILTPEVNTEISPVTCASAIAEYILTQQPVTRDQVFLGRANDETFLIIYGLPMDQAVLRNTHIISSRDAVHCVEAHVSKISTSDSDIEPWFNGFGDSSIEKL